MICPVFHLLTGYVPAFNQIWILGDSLLKETTSALIDLKNGYINDPIKPRLYMHDNYDIIPCYDESAKGNFLKQIRNSLVHLTKAHYKLPSKILILLDNEILDETAFAVTQLANALKWLFNEMESIITTRRSQLPLRCLKPGEPSVFLLKMIPRGIKSENISLFKSVRRKINNLIPAIAEKFEYGFINACEITSDSTTYFDRSGKKLAPAGIIKLWESISQIIQEMDQSKEAKSKPEASTPKRDNNPHEVSPWRQTQYRRQESPRHDNSRRFNRRPSGFHERRNTFSTYDYDRYHYHANRKY